MANEVGADEDELVQEVGEDDATDEDVMEEDTVDEDVAEKTREKEGEKPFKLLVNLLAMSSEAVRRSTRLRKILQI